MKLYFDTNIYSFVASTGEAAELRTYLRRERHIVTASQGNITEIYAIPDRAVQRSELETLTKVASSYEKRPQSWAHAKEVRNELRRCHPDWLRTRPDPDNRIREFLRGHQEAWKMAKRSDPPDSNAYLEFQSDFEVGVRKYRATQKQDRKKAQSSTRTFTTAMVNKEKVTLFYSESRDDPEIRWRFECLSVWHNAIVKRVPESRDYADWLLPYLREGAFEHTDYAKFWLEDVEAARIPKNRICGLVNFYQQEFKITHGNPADQIHTSNLLDADIFVTADKAFYSVLKKIIGNHFPGRSKPVLLNRGAESALEELRKVIDYV